MDIPEVIVVSDSGNQSVNCAIFDLKTGAHLVSYKEGNSGRKCLSLVRQEYLISAFNNQAALKAWLLCDKDVTRRMVLPGLATSLAVSNCGMYCAAAFDNSFYVWEVATGILVTCLEHHSQSISCLRFSCDDSHLISGGKDGMVLVWLFFDIIAMNERSDHPKPRYTWIHHAAEVTDIYVGSLGIYSRVVTASKDMTCKVYELETGNLMCTLHVDYAITAITMDDAEYFLILGSMDGSIYRINMFNVNEAEVQYSSSDKKNAFLGHSKEITCLSVSITGKYLLSGSEDATCRIWDMMNFSCYKKMTFNGPVTNAFISLKPSCYKNDSEYRPSLNMSTFKRSYSADEEGSILTSIGSHKLSLMHAGAPNDYFDSRLLNFSEDSILALNKDSLSEQKMSNINYEMYAYALCEGYDQPDDSDPIESD